MEILIFLIAVAFGFGAIGDKEQENRDNYTMICIACILAIAVIRIF
ncbi:hypothetical protein [Sporofaciens sp. SGI.106]